MGNYTMKLRPIQVISGVEVNAMTAYVPHCGSISKASSFMLLLLSVITVERYAYTNAH